MPTKLFAPTLLGVAIWSLRYARAAHTELKTVVEYNEEIVSQHNELVDRLNATQLALNEVYRQGKYLASLIDAHDIVLDEFDAIAINFNTAEDE